jgi:hypothetical protein
MKTCKKWRFDWLAAAVALLLLATNCAVAQDGAMSQMPRLDTKRLGVLMNSELFPLPLLSVAVPELTTPKQVQELLNGKADYILMLYQAKGPHSEAQVTDLYAFQLWAIQYVGNPRPPGHRPPIPPLHFATIAVDITPEATAPLGLSTNAVRPVYVLFDHNKTGPERLRMIDLAKETGEFTQQFAQEWIGSKLRILPSVLNPRHLTADNYQKIVDQEPVGEAPTAKLIVVLYGPSGPSGDRWFAALNRDKVVCAIAYYKYRLRVRFAFADLGSDPQVYRALTKELKVPTEPQLWITDPVTKTSVQYKPGKDGPELTELTLEALEAWLEKTKNVAPPPVEAIRVEWILLQVSNVDNKQEALLTRQQ